MGLLQDFVSWVKEIRNDMRIPKEEKITFKSSPDLMEEDKFWRMINAANIRAEFDYDYMYRELENDLRLLSPDEIILFANRLRQLRGKACTWDLWGIAYIVNGGCEEKCFREFREWLIGQGREFYYNTLLYPESIVDVDREKVEYIDWEGLGAVPGEVFQELTEQEMPEPFQENETILGTEWDENSDDLKNRFPKLVEKYANQTEEDEY